MKRIIYQTPEGGVAVIIPSGELPIEEVARKDVPAGVQFKIIDTVDVPSDRTFRAAWEADMTESHGSGIGQKAWFIEQYQAELAVVTAAEVPARSSAEEQTDEQYAEVVAQFEASRTARIEQLNKQIAAMQAELEAA